MRVGLLASGLELDTDRQIAPLLNSRGTVSSAGLAWARRGSLRPQLGGDPRATLQYCDCADLMAGNHVLLDPRRLSTFSKMHELEKLVGTLAAACYLFHGLWNGKFMPETNLLFQINISGVQCQ